LSVAVSSSDKREISAKTFSFPVPLKKLLNFKYPHNFLNFEVYTDFRRIKKGLHKVMNNCPCCGNPLLRHVRHGSNVYWFCQSCWSEMPNFDLMHVLIAQRKSQQNLSSIGRLGYNKLADAIGV
jgi:ribosomal protein L37AE/L43A